MAKGVFVVFNREYDNPICGVFTNITKVHEALSEMMDDDYLPAYSKLVADFKDRKNFLNLRNYYENNAECINTFEVEYTELNFNSLV